eukprot:c29317_g2_i1 orf=155-880(-)
MLSISLQTSMPTSSSDTYRKRISLLCVGEFGSEDHPSTVSCSNWEAGVARHITVLSFFPYISFSVCVTACLNSPKLKSNHTDVQIAIQIRMVIQFFHQNPRQGQVGFRAAVAVRYFLDLDCQQFSSGMLQKGNLNIMLHSAATPETKGFAVGQGGSCCAHPHIKADKPTRAGISSSIGQTSPSRQRLKWKAGCMAHCSVVISLLAPPKWQQKPFVHLGLSPMGASMYPTPHQSHRKMRKSN